MNKEDITPILVEKKIFLIRGKQVMIDRDLAELYGVETKVINQAVKRNIERFPEEFNTLKHSSVCPHAFTEQGVAMLSAVLRSDTAVQVSIRIMNAFA